MRQITITNLKSQPERVRVPNRPAWEGRFKIGLGHTLLTMSEQVTRACRCFIQLERSAKDQEWKEVDRVNYEEYVDWIMRDYAAGTELIPYRRPTRKGSYLGCVLCLVFLTSCADLVTPPMHLMPAYPQGEAARQARIAEKATWPGGIRPFPDLYKERVTPVGAYWVPVSGSPGILQLVRPKPPALWDACSIYGMDLSKWQALQPRVRETQRFVNYYRGYQDRNLKTKPVVALPNTAPAPGAGPTAIPDDVQRGMNWEDQYDYGGDGNYLGGGGGYLP